MDNSEFNLNSNYLNDILNVNDITIHEETYKELKPFVLNQNFLKNEKTVLSDLNDFLQSKLYVLEKDLSLLLKITFKIKGACSLLFEKFDFLYTNFTNTINNKFELLNTEIKNIYKSFPKFNNYLDNISKNNLKNKKICNNVKLSKSNEKNNFNNNSSNSIIESDDKDFDILLKNSSKFFKEDDLNVFKLSGLNNKNNNDSESKSDNLKNNLIKDNHQYNKINKKFEPNKFNFLLSCSNEKIYLSLYENLNKTNDLNIFLVCELNGEGEKKLYKIYIRFKTKKRYSSFADDNLKEVLYDFRKNKPINDFKEQGRIIFDPFKVAK